MNTTSAHSYAPVRAGQLSAFLLVLAAQAAMAAPANDNFASRITLTGAAVDTVGDNTDATLQAGEIDPGGYGGASVWYQWTAPASGWVTIHTVAAAPANELDTVLAVFTGSTLASLQMLGHNDESFQNEAFGSSRLVFQATAGTAYQIAVHGWTADPDPAVEGPFELHIAPAVPELRVASLTVSPAAVNVTSAAQTVTVSARVVAEAGWSVGFASASMAPSSPDFFAGPNGSLTRISGTDVDGVHEAVISIPRYVTPGIWPVDISIGDGETYLTWSPQGNDFLEDGYLLPAAISGKVTVTNTGAVDITPPVVTAISGFPATVDVSAGDVSFDVTLTVQDSLSGFASAPGSLPGSIYDGYNGVSFGAMHRISGTPQNGVYRVTFTVAQDTPAGIYYPDVHVEDEAFNDAGHSDDPEYSDHAGLPPSNTVLSYTVISNGPVGFAAWQQSSFTPAEAAISGATADPDGDGVQNLVEFALGTQPKTADSGAYSVVAKGTPLPAPQNASPVPALRLTTPATLPAGVTLTIEGLNAAGQWLPLASANSSQDWTATPQGWIYLRTTPTREVFGGWAAPGPAGSMLRVRATYQP